MIDHARGYIRIKAVEGKQMRPTLRTPYYPSSFTSQHKHFFAAIVSIVVAISTPGNAQGTSNSAMLSGTVSDVTGARVPGATVRLTHPGHPPLQTTTDDQGDFQINAEPGEYTLETVAPGFALYRLPLSVSAHNPHIIRIGLQIEMRECSVCPSFLPPIETLDASLTTTLPLLPMPPYRQTSKKSRPLAR
jgi:Carboxypeptidase regulatory-like domain